MLGHPIRQTSNHLVSGFGVLNGLNLSRGITDTRLPVESMSNVTRDVLKRAHVYTATAGGHFK
jgi:hypothetical protein